MKAKILYKLGIHKWKRWRINPYRGDRMTRQCERYFKYEDIRISQ